MSGLAAVLSQWCEARRAGPGRPRDVTGSLAAWGGRDRGMASGTS
jgi:hypothetical protein